MKVPPRTLNIEVNEQFAARAMRLHNSGPVIEFGPLCIFLQHPRRLPVLLQVGTTAGASKRRRGGVHETKKERL